MAPSDVPSVLSADAIRAAYHAVPPEFRDSPQFLSDGLSDRAGAPIVVKVECVNPIRSFKGRGTSIALAGLLRAREVSAGRGVATVSTGNFGQGVAYAARALGVPATVVVPQGANPVEARGDPPAGRADRRGGARRRRRRAPARARARRLGTAARRPRRPDRDRGRDAGARGDRRHRRRGRHQRGTSRDRGRVRAGRRRVADRGRRDVAAGPGRGRPGHRRPGPVGAGDGLSWRTGRVEVVPPEPSRADGLASATGNADLLPRAPQGRRRLRARARRGAPRCPARAARASSA